MKKIYLFFIAILLIFCSCTKNYLAEESNEETPIELEEWKNGGSENIDAYPD